MKTLLITLGLVESLSINVFADPPTAKKSILTPEMKEKIKAEMEEMNSNLRSIAPPMLDMDKISHPSENYVRTLIPKYYWNEPATPITP